ncbi:unnamed protein product, partial [Hydatigera taeniaeformis]|uniref:Histone H2A n=1 Tax=Hydatigena taeniaeformis TaxID=6205 RepID=A0A0R3XCV0_HYDTA
MSEKGGINNSRDEAKGKSVRARPLFPVGRVRRMLRGGNYAERVDAAGSVFMIAVLEYLTAS